MGDEEFDKLFNEIFGRDFTRAEIGLTERAGNIELERQGTRVRDLLRTSLSENPESRASFLENVNYSESAKVKAARGDVKRYNQQVVDYNKTIAELERTNALEGRQPSQSGPQRVTSQQTLSEFNQEVLDNQKYIDANLRSTLAGQAVEAGVTSVPTRTRRSVSSSRSKSSVSSALLRL